MRKYYACPTSEEVYKDEDFYIVNCGFDALVSAYFLERTRPDFYLLLVTSGTITHEYKGTKYKLKPGEMFLYYPNEPQKIYAKKEDATVTYWVHFAGAKAEAFIEELQLSPGPIYPKTPDNILKLYVKILNEYKIRDQHYEKLALANLINLLITTTRDPKSSSLKKELSKAVEAMTLNPNITNAECAKICNLSVVHFMRVFKSIYKMSPHQYKQRLIIEQAKELLINSDSTLVKIAEVLGFEDNPLYFNRLFKHFTGITPTQYRKQNK